MKHLRFILTLGLMAGALYHFYCAFFPAVPDDEIGKRHLAFLVVNMAGAGLLIVDRPKLLLLFPPFMIQQIHSRGTGLITGWKLHQIIDWHSLVVLSMMPLLGLYIVIRNKQETVSKEDHPKQRPQIRRKK